MARIKEFIKDESGVETIEWLAIIVVAAVLVGIVVAIGKRLNASGETGQNKINLTMPS